MQAESPSSWLVEAAYLACKEGSASFLAPTRYLQLRAPFRVTFGNDGG